jgi:catechol 2,3-dioxygenase-like lactoylglutathione lyase family enzyme
MISRRTQSETIDQVHVNDFAKLDQENRAMPTSAHRKAAKTPQRPAAGRKAAPTRQRRPPRLIDDVTAILLISKNAKKLYEFYRTTLGLPLEAEDHDGMPLHYGCDLGDVHVAIHPAEGWPGVPTPNAQSPVITFSTSKLKVVAARLTAHGVKVTGPTDHGFALGVSFRDPDGNHVSIVEYGPEYW